MTLRSAASLRKVSRSMASMPPETSGARGTARRGPRARSAQRQGTRVEAGAVAGVAGGAGLVDLDQEGVAVAVEGHGLDELDVAGGVALDPVLAAAAAPVRAAAGGQGAAQGLVVHPAEHE